MAIEIDFSNDPWTIEDCTHKLSEEGQAAEKIEAERHRGVMSMAVEDLRREVEKRYADDDVIGIAEAEKFLCERHLKRGIARNLIEAHDGMVHKDAARWNRIPVPHGRGKIGLYPALVTRLGGKLDTSLNTSNSADISDPPACRTDNERTASSGQPEIPAVARNAMRVELAAEQSDLDGKLDFELITDDPLTPEDTSTDSGWGRI